MFTVFFCSASYKTKTQDRLFFKTEIKKEPNACTFGPLAGLKFILHKVDSAACSPKISKLGGEVVSTLNEDVAAVVSIPGMLYIVCFQLIKGMWFIFHKTLILVAAPLILGINWIRFFSSFFFNFFFLQLFSTSIFLFNFYYYFY